MPDLIWPAHLLIRADTGRIPLPDRSVDLVLGSPLQPGGEHHRVDVGVDIALANPHHPETDLCQIRIASLILGYLLREAVPVVAIDFDDKVSVRDEEINEADLESPLPLPVNAPGFQPRVNHLLRSGHTPDTIAFQGAECSSVGCRPVCLRPETSLADRAFFLFAVALRLGRTAMRAVAAAELRHCVRRRGVRRFAMIAPSRNLPSGVDRAALHRTEDVGHTEDLRRRDR
jgi:hypothetical protein